jgi:hypothetical protein
MLPTIALLNPLISSHVPNDNHRLEVSDTIVVNNIIYSPMRMSIGSTLFFNSSTPYLILLSSTCIVLFTLFYLVDIVFI